MRRPGIIPNHDFKLAVPGRPSSGRPVERSRSGPAELQAEALALRHQLRVLQRQVRRPRRRSGDRLVLATIIARLPKRRWSALLPSPETILRWHRELVRRRWGAFGKGARRLRPAIDPEVVDLILRLARENPRWGVPPDPGRATEAGPPMFTCDCSQSDAVASGATSAQAVDANVGRVGSPARRQSARG
jgi:hypothetical protein